MRGYNSREWALSCTAVDQQRVRYSLQCVMPRCPFLATYAIVTPDDRETNEGESAILFPLFGWKHSSMFLTLLFGTIPNKTFETESDISEKSQTFLNI